MRFSRRKILAVGTSTTVALLSGCSDNTDQNKTRNDTDTVTTERNEIGDDITLELRVINYTNSDQEVYLKLGSDEEVLFEDTLELMADDTEYISLELREGNYSFTATNQDRSETFPAKVSDSMGALIVEVRDDRLNIIQEEF